ncbi:MAG: P27 family phage terminase small subunit [Deltaproteobacteria bacterium]|nr:P27 family phage terminase small subunit [Deltaproteobacteria bacterium]MBW2151781.1 P27 family phage terminase small subunit [Deltaproteobacteria bacterium]
MILAKYELGAHELAIFRGSCDNLNRFMQAKKLMDEEGIVVTAPTGQKKKHPAAEIERQAWLAFISGMRALAISEAYDEFAPPARRQGRPPGIPRR